MKKLIIMLVPLMWSCYQGKERHNSECDIFYSPRREMMRNSKSRWKIKYNIELRKNEKLLESYYEQRCFVVKTIDTVNNNIHLYKLGDNRVLEEYIIPK